MARRFGVLVDESTIRAFWESLSVYRILEEEGVIGSCIECAVAVGEEVDATTSWKEASDTCDVFQSHYDQVLPNHEDVNDFVLEIQEHRR